MLAGLTPREQEVAVLVVDGLADREIAERLYLSHHTVSQYVKRIYRKLNVDSRVLLLGLYLQDGMGMTPFASGLAFTPLAVLFVAASLVAPRLFARVGERLIAAGAAVMAVSAAGVAIAVAASRPSGTTAALIAGLAVMCVGPGIVVPGVINAALRSVPTDSAGSASGVLSTAQQIGNALGVAIAGAVFFGVLGDAQGARAYDRAFAIALAWTVATAAISGLLALRLATDRGEAATAAASVPDRVRPDDPLPELGRRAA